MKRAAIVAIALLASMASGTLHAQVPIGPSGGTGTGATGAVGADPTATAGASAVLGTATTFMRSDAAPAVRLGTNAAPGLVQGDGTSVGVVAGSASVVGIPPSVLAGAVSVSAGCGQTAVGSGGPIVTILSVFGETRAITTYPATVAIADCGGLLVFRSGSNVVVNLPLAGSAGFAQGYFVTLCNAAAGTVTLTPTGGTIGTGATYVLATATEAGRICAGVYSGTYTGAAGAFVASDWGLVTGH